ncbi:MAG: cation:dicarboxylase symporter family transporter [Nitrososphaerales archaeon]
MGFQSLSESDISESGSNTELTSGRDSLWPPIRYLASLYRRFCDATERYLPLIVVCSFIGGIFLAKSVPLLAEYVNSGVEGLVDQYGTFAPLVIFLILAPSLSRMLSARGGKGGKFVSYAIVWLSFRRLLSLGWAVIFTTVVFGFPFWAGHGANVSSSAKQSLDTLLDMAVHSNYFYAMYLSVIAALLTRHSRLLKVTLSKTLNGVEILGQYMVPFIPLFMVAIGCYVYQLPENVNSQIGAEGALTVPLQPLRVLGMNFESSTAVGMVKVYVIISLLIGVACILWHLMLLLWTKYRINSSTVYSFSIKEYFLNYWVKVYPLLWATSSEALATPLNLFLVKRHYPWIRTNVRRFVIGIGSYLSINGTMICVIVLAGAVASILGVELTGAQLLLSAPLVFLIGFGVPGIPGELLLFGGPVVMLFNLPPEVAQVFLTLYLGLQIGLPDSFRTGNNSTDDCVQAILLNDVYERKYQSDQDLIEELLQNEHFVHTFAALLEDRKEDTVHQ